MKASCTIIVQNYGLPLVGCAAAVLLWSKSLIWNTCTYVKCIESFAYTQATKGGQLPLLERLPNYLATWEGESVIKSSKVGSCTKLYCS